MKIISRGKIFILLVFALLSLISGGFSTWIIGANNPAVLNGIINVGDVITQNALTSLGATKFTICQDGIVGDGTTISECGIDFKFQLAVSKFSSSTKSIYFSSSTVFSNINSSIESYLLETSVTELDSNKTTAFTGTFAAFNSSNKTQNHTSNFSVNLDHSKPNKAFYITYKFKGNFYNILNGNLKISLSLN